jgi:hypothetical protein
MANGTDTAPLTRRNEVMAALGNATDRFVVLVRSISPEAGEQAVPGMSWTAAETGAHVCSLFRRATTDRRRGADRADVARLNDEVIAEIGTDLTTIAEEIEQQHTLLQEIAPHVGTETKFPFHCGVPITFTGGMAVIVGELEVHGDDIARATGRPWQIDGRHLLLVWRNALQVLEGWARPGALAGVDETWVMRFLDEPPPIALQIADGRVIVDPEAPEPWPDVGSPEAAPVVHQVEVADPVTFSLGFPYGRIPVDDPQVARLAALFQPV